MDAGPEYPMPEGCRWMGNPSHDEIQATSAEAFLEALSPIKGLPRSLQQRRPFMYRGVGNSSWRLIPTSRRVNGIVPQNCIGQDTIRNRIFNEAETLQRFISLTDKRGLPMSGEATQTIRIRDRRVMIGAYVCQVWPPPTFESALALAQHSGIPTSLLDFTWNPYVAAYFAVRSYCAHASPERTLSICVWIAREPAAISQNTGNELVHVVKPNYFDNRNLHAQEGLFVYHPEWLEFEKVDDPTSRQSPLEDLWVPKGDKSPLIKLTLEACHASALMRYLITLGFDAARLFPGYSGIAQALGEYAFAQVDTLIYGQ